MGTYQSSVGFLADAYLNDIPYSIPSRSRIGGALVVTKSNLSICSSHFDGIQAEVGGAINFSS